MLLVRRTTSNQYPRGRPSGLNSRQVSGLPTCQVMGSEECFGSFRSDVDVGFMIAHLI